MLLLMCDTEEPGEQEIALGIETCCLVRTDQAGTSYGGVERVSVEAAAPADRRTHGRE
jgi:hypothetical protein